MGGRREYAQTVRRRWKEYAIGRGVVAILRRSDLAFCSSRMTLISGPMIEESTVPRVASSGI